MCTGNGLNAKVMFFFSNFSCNSLLYNFGLEIYPSDFQKLYIVREVIEKGEKMYGLVKCDFLRKGAIFLSGARLSQNCEM